jgi:hypothetical protein
MNNSYDKKIQQLQERLVELSREVAITIWKIVEYERLQKMQPVVKKHNPLDVLASPITSGLAYLEQTVRRLVASVIKVRK